MRPLSLFALAVIGLLNGLTDLGLASVSAKVFGIFWLIFVAVLVLEPLFPSVGNLFKRRAE